MVITSDLVDVFWQPSRMASSCISLREGRRIAAGNPPAYPLRVLSKGSRHSRAGGNPVKIKTAGGSPAAITNDLPSVVCWVSQMASSSISHFLLLRQNESNQREKATLLERPTGTFGRSIKLGDCATRPNVAHKTCHAAELKHNQRLGWRRLPA